MKNFFIILQWLAPPESKRHLLITHGTLFILATPIGNLGDFSARAIETLQHVDLIAAEDTRHSQRLLQHFQISKPLIALHAHNEARSTDKLIGLLKTGKSIALISDAGTPLISDPGQPLVASAHQAGIPVTPIPGPCAAITALSATGFPHHEFTFIGFLPPKSTQRQQALQVLQAQTRTLIFYEAPHRIVNALIDMQTIFGGERRACFARELTKRYETLRVATLRELAQWVTTDKTQQQGECVIIVEGAPPQEKTLTPACEATLRLLLAELPIKKAAQLASQITGVRKNVLYDLALALQSHTKKQQ